MIHNSFDPELAKRIVKQVPLFAKFTEEELSLPLDRTSVYSYRKDETIIQADDHNSQMYIVFEGRVKVVGITVDGEERVLAFRRRIFPGFVIGFKLATYHEPCRVPVDEPPSCIHVAPALSVIYNSYAKYDGWR